MLLRAVDPEGRDQGGESLTKRKPKRDANGHFLPRGQTPREKSRPDARPESGGIVERPDAPYLPQGGETYVIVQGGRGGGKSAAQEAMLEGKEKVLVVKPPERRRCEDCGTEMQERRTIVRGMVIYLTHCPRCVEDPVGVIRG